MSLSPAFFSAIRPHFGGKLTSSQVAGIEAIDKAWGKYGDGNFQRYAYALATPNVETGGTYAPIHERGARSYFNKYEPGTAIGKRLGNIKKGDGYLYRGRGLVQITGRDNYSRVGKIIGVDLIANPDKALDLDIAAKILVEGIMRGWFTGKGLSSYIDDIDESDEEDLREFIQARRTVNGQDKADKIGRDALAFEKALKASATVINEPALPTPERPNTILWGVVLVVILAAVFFVVTQVKF